MVCALNLNRVKSVLILWLYSVVNIPFCILIVQGGLIDFGSCPNVLCCNCPEKSHSALCFQCSNLVKRRMRMSCISCLAEINIVTFACSTFNSLSP